MELKRFFYKENKLDGQQQESRFFLFTKRAGPEPILQFSGGRLRQPDSIAMRVAQTVHSGGSGDTQYKEPGDDPNKRIFEVVIVSKAGAGS